MELSQLLSDSFAPTIPVFGEFNCSLADMGGTQGGKTMCTEAFRNAVQACTEAGGGTIIVPEGEWLTGPIHLRSNIRLHLDKGAVILFSKDVNDYLPVVFTRWEGIECYNYSPLIYAYGCSNIAITGEGRLVGNGEAWWAWKKTQHDAANILYNAEYDGIPVEKRIFGITQALRPSFIQPIECRNVLIEGVTVENGPMWTIHPIYCDNLTVRGITIRTEGPNTDGLNPDSCTNVLIEKCRFETGDDCIAINSGMNEDGWRVNRPSENIVIRNCLMHEGHGGVVIGSGMSGGIRNIAITDCTFTGGERGIRLKSMRGRGGFVENIHVSDIRMTDIREEAIIINMFYQSTTILPKTETPPKFENITIQNVEGDGAKVAVALYGLPELPLRQVKLENIHITADTGLLSNHVEGLVLNNVNLESSKHKPE